MGEVIKAILIKGEFSTMKHLMNVAYCEGKKLFCTKQNINVVYMTDSPFGWIVLVENPEVDEKSLKIGVEKGIR